MYSTPEYDLLIDEVDSLENLLWDFVLPVENIPSLRGGRSRVKPAIHVGIKTTSLNSYIL